jgi:hypothetical protein
MYVNGVYVNLGNQDRSLSAAAIALPGSITIIKDATPEGSTSFSFTASPTPLANFSLVDDGTSANTKVFSNITTFQTYSISESPPSAGWAFNDVTCSVTSANGGSYTKSGATVEIVLKEGENWTCTYTNTFVQQTPTVVTEIHNDDTHTAVTSVPVGSTVHDQATVSGNLGTPTGNVVFSWFTNGTCNGTPAATSNSLSLSGGVIDATTFPQGPLAAGISAYSFKAHYNGDSNYLPADSACEPLTVDKGTSSVATTLHKADHSVVAVGGSVDLGTVMHDLATVTVSGSFAPTGNVAFTFYGNGTCEGTGASAGSIALDGASPGVAHPSDSTAALAAGTYAFKASWIGDNNYTGNTSLCENFTVNKADSNVVTEIHNANHEVVTIVLEGTVVHDKATVGGIQGFVPTGSVDFTWYTNGTCSGEGFSAGTVPLVNGVAHPSNNEMPLAAGDYAFKAHYSGDGNYNASDSACEPLEVIAQTGVLLPTQTTCEMYASGNYPPMYDAFLYQTRNNNKIFNISPGVIFYYNTIEAPSASFSFTVVETNDHKTNNLPDPWNAMLWQSSIQTILYNSDCTKASGVSVSASGTTSPYTITFTVTGANPNATYYIGIMYSPANLKGQVATGNPTVIYTWETFINGVYQNGSTASIPVKPKF